MNEVKLIHKANLRFRFKLKELNNLTNSSVLKSRIEKFQNIESLKINTISKSIIIYAKEGFNQDKFLEFLRNLVLEKLEITDNVCCNKMHKIPSKKEIYISFSSLLFSYLFKNGYSVAALSYLSCSPILIDGAKELLKEGLNSRVLEATAVGVSLARKDFIAANSTNAMLALGEYMEESTSNKSDDLIKELAKPNIAEAWIEKKENGKIIEKRISTKDIKVGDIVIVGSGDSIAIDGHIVSGSASVNQISMTGEAEAVKKERGDRVMSGTVVEDGKIRIWAEQVGDQTSTAKIKHYISSSLDEKSNIALKASKLADNLVPLTLALAGISYAVNQNTTSLASVLQADYSCALKLATPVAFKSSISKAGKNGILVKGAKALEALAEVDTFVFDKTGTLTSGKLEVVKVYSFKKDWSEQKLLNLTASAEEHYFHPVAEAVVEAAKQRGFIHMHHDEVEFIVAHGVKTIVNNKEVIIGSRHFLEDDEKISFKGHEKAIKTSLKSGYALLYVAFNKELLGTICMMDRPRVNTKSTIEKLRRLGAKEIIMLSGDVKQKAESLGKELGIDTVYSDMLPTDKAKILEELKEKGKKIAFIGDGINDAPSLIKADVGISMQRGADIAKASADISLLKDNIAAVAEIKEISNETMKLVNQNFNATVGINSVILLAATAGLLNPTATAILHNGTTIGLLLNSIKGGLLKGNSGEK